MTNKQFISLLMEHPMNVPIDFSCGSCSCSTFHGESDGPKITLTGGNSYPYLSLRFNDGFKGEHTDLKNVATEALLKEIQNRIESGESK